VRNERLCFGGHLSMENRNGLCAEFRTDDPMTRTESMVALEQIQPHPNLHFRTRINTVGSLRRCRYQGRERTQARGHFVVGDYNLLRMARLSMGTAD
jgi:hypothetical protein